MNTIGKLKIKFYDLIELVLVMCSSIAVPLILRSMIESSGIKLSGTNITVVSNIIYILILFFYYKKDIFEETKKFKENFTENIDCGFKYWLMGLGILMVSNFILNVLVFDGISANENGVREMLKDFPIQTIFSIAVIAPITEEIIYRKAPRKIFKSMIPYAIFCAVTFGFVHVLADFSLLNLLYIVPYGALGYGFAIMNYKSKTILTSITMHAIHNVFTYLLILLTQILPK